MFPTFLFKKCSLKIPSEITFETTETNWVCMIVFLCAHMLEFPYRPIYWQALLFIYRIGLHQVTPLGVVFLFMLVNCWVEKHQRFLFNVYKRFFIFVTFFTFFNVFLFFSGRFFYIYAVHQKSSTLHCAVVTMKCTDLKDLICWLVDWLFIYIYMNSQYWSGALDHKGYGQVSASGGMRLTRPVSDNR